MRRMVSAAAVAAVLVSATTACDGSHAEPDPSPSAGPTTTVQTPPESTVVQHETGVGSPIGADGLSVPDGATQLGPLVRRRSPELIAAYKKVLRKYEKRQAREQAAENEGKKPTPTTPTPTEAFPTVDTFKDLDNPPEPDVTTALLRVDDDPGTVFKEVLSQVAETLPGLGVDPKKWSQYCHAKHGLYTGCKVSVSGRTVEDEGVRITVTLDPGNIKTRTAPAGADKRPVMTVTTESTDPIDTSDALESDRPSPPPTTPASPASPSPLAQGPPVHAKWPTMKRPAPAGPDAPLLTNRWKIRDYTTLLLSGNHPAFAIMVADRRANADAVARSYVLEYSTAGLPRRNVLEDRTEISVTYTARTGKHGPKVSSTYIQAGRGDYIALFYQPPHK